MAWDLKSDRPIYAQLVENIQLMVISGIFPAGSKLPSVRYMAADAAVNPNTMQRALAQLENDGLLFAQRTAGRFVTDDTEKIAKVKNDFAEGLTNEFLGKISKLGYDKKQISALINRIMEGNEHNG